LVQRKTRAVEASTYEVEAQLARRHWWFQGRRRILDRLVASLDPPLPPDALALDVGCGTGANASVLAARAAFSVGIDASQIPLGLRATDQPGHDARLRGDATALPFPDHSFDLVVALDVLEHLDDDAAGAREIRRVLRPGGVVVIFVPALRLLWGLQDQVSHHRRRYHREQLGQLAFAAGLRVERLTFFNSFLFPPILAARVIMRLRPSKTLISENEIGGPLTNAVLGAVFGAEAPLLQRVDFPVGVSLACLARR
jgi:SAM-dependent methyltransferase